MQTLFCQRACYVGVDNLIFERIVAGMNSIQNNTAMVWHRNIWSDQEGFSHGSPSPIVDPNFNKSFMFEKSVYNVESKHMMNENIEQFDVTSFDFWSRKFKLHVHVRCDNW